MTRTEAIAIRQAQLSGKPCDASKAEEAFQLLSIPPRRRDVLALSIGNPWKLTGGMCEALDTLAKTGSVPDAAGELGLAERTIHAQIGRAKDRMGVLHTIQAVLEWDRYARKAA